MSDAAERRPLKERVMERTTVRQRRNRQALREVMVRVALLLVAYALAAHFSA